MQKIRNIIIILSLLVSTTGVSLSKHYSRGTLYSVALFGNAESCCEIPCDCCDDETDFMKLDVDFVSSTFDSPEISVIDIFSDFNISFISYYNIENLNFVHTFDHYKDISMQAFICELAF